MFHLSKPLDSSGLFRGLTDWHSHVLPGVDDGVQTLKESLAVLTWYEQLGISELWLTPHVMEDIPNKSADLRRRFHELCEAWHGSVTLHLAAEYMIDNLFDQRLAASDLLPLGDDSHLLVETSYFNPPMQFHQRLERLQDAGYTPVLAHPERYVYMESDDYRRLLDMGILFQLNLPSLTGMYGRMAKKKAEQLLAEGCYTLLGTDIHSLAVHREQLHQRVSRKHVALCSEVLRSQHLLSSPPLIE